MKQLFDYVVGYLREDFHPGYYATIGLFLLAAFVLNFGANFKLAVLNPAIGRPTGVLYFFLFYGCAYYFAVFAWAFFHRDTRLLRSRSFWGVSAFAIGAMALDNYSTNLPDLLVGSMGIPEPVRDWVRACVWNLDRMLAIALPVVVFRRFVDRQPGAFYGVVWRDLDWRPVAAMLAIMAPLVAWASLQPAFHATYPGPGVGAAAEHLGLSRAAALGLYESTYALRIVAIELFFRGLLVLGLTRRFGRAAFMPMVTLYTFWHFGKPVPEAVGSIVAGYVLGAFALRSGSIVGGTLVHVGVALGMDLAVHLHAAATAG